jgi:hypothetical protein
VKCGTGNDTVRADRIDKLMSCEQIKYRKPKKPTP